MAGRNTRFEVLLVSMIFVNICVIILVLSTQKNEVVNEIKSKSHVLGRLKEFNRVIYVDQSSPVELNTRRNHMGEVIGKSNNDRWDYKQRNDLKTSNNSRNGSNLPVLYQYCPEGGTMLGNVDKSFSLFDNTVVKISVFSHKQNKYAFHFKRMKQLKF